MEEDTQKSTDNILTRECFSWALKVLKSLKDNAIQINHHPDEYTKGTL